MDDRIKLAEAMGWTTISELPVRAECDGWYGIYPQPNGGKLNKPLPDPFTDANDDYACLEHMRKFGIDDSSYRVGDFARKYLEYLNENG